MSTPSIDCKFSTPLGGNKLTQATVDALNEAFGTNLDRDQMRRAVEALKKEHRIPGNHHGPIDALGNYHKKGGGIIDNIGNFIP